MVVRKDEPVALAVRHKSGSSSRFTSANRKPLHCSYCDRDHHVRETCWKLNGYPLGHPRHASEKSSHFRHTKINQSSVNRVKEAPPMQQLQSVMNGLSELQLQQMLSIMQGNGSSASAAPKANNATIPSGLPSPELIIDSGATDHITSSSALLLKSKKKYFFTTSCYAKWRTGSYYLYWKFTFKSRYLFKKCTWGTILQSQFDVCESNHQ